MYLYICIHTYEHILSRSISRFLFFSHTYCQYRGWYRANVAHSLCTERVNVPHRMCHTLSAQRG